MTDTIAPSTHALARYHALDSLRGICACTVALFHFVTTGFISGLAVVRGGALFVDFFFVLSGFVITASYGTRLAGGFPVAKFMFLRFFRIYPLHVAVLAMFVLLELFGMALPGLTGRAPFTGSRSLDGLIANLLLLQTFNPASGLSWNNPAWSIAAEFWTYLIAALIFRFSNRFLHPFTSCMVLACGWWLAATPHFLAHASDWGIVRCIYGFGFGMAAFQLYGRLCDRLADISLAMITVVEASSCGLALWLVSLSIAHPALSMLAPPSFVAVIVIFAAERGALSMSLLARPMRLLGPLSYSIYMVHEFVQGRLLDMLRLAGDRFGFAWVVTRENGFKDMIAPPLVSDALTMLMLVLVICLAWLTYHGIEQPARNWSRVKAERLWRDRQVAAQERII